MGNLAKQNQNEIVNCGIDAYHEFCSRKASP